MTKMSAVDEHGRPGNRPSGPLAYFAVFLIGALVGIGIVEGFAPIYPKILCPWSDGRCSQPKGPR